MQGSLVGKENDKFIDQNGKACVQSAIIDSSGNVVSSFGGQAGLEIPAHDYIGMTYTGDDLTTVVYKTGGAGGTTVATLTLAYSSGVLQSVTKS